MTKLDLFNGEVSKNLKSYRDSAGLIFHKRDDGVPDGGDSLQRQGMFISSLYLRREPYTFEAKTLNKYLVAPGLYCRYPDKNSWTSSPLNCSGDQHRSLLIALGYVGNKQAVLDFLKLQLKRGMFYPNIQHNDEPNWNQDEKFWIKGVKPVGDFAGPNHAGIYIRALKAWYLYPLLFLADIQTLISTVLAIRRSYKKPDHSDDLNLIQMIMQSMVVLPTLLGHISAFLLANFRAGYEVSRLSSGELLFKRDKTINGVQYALDFYFYNKYAPPINKLWYAIINKYFKKRIKL